MNTLKHLFLFVMMTVLTGCVLFILVGPLISQDISVLRDGTGTERWEAVGAGMQDNAAAIRWDNGRLAVQAFSVIEGKRTGNVWRARLPEEFSGGVIAGIYPIREDLLFAGVYSRNAEELGVFRLGKGRNAEILLREGGEEGKNFSSRSGKLSLSGFYQEDRVISFSVADAGVIRSFLCHMEAGGLEALAESGMGNRKAMTFLSLRDGTLIQGGKGFLSVGGQDTGIISNATILTKLSSGRMGWYFLDESNLTVFYIDPGMSNLQRLFSVEEAIGERTLTSFSIDANENALLLLDGKELIRVSTKGTIPLKGILEHGRAGCFVRIVLYGILVLLVGFILWFAICGVQQGYTSMSAYMGSTLLSITLLFVLVFHYGVLKDDSTERSLEENRNITAAVLRSLGTQYIGADGIFAKAYGSVVREASGREAEGVSSAVVSSTVFPSTGLPLANGGDAVRGGTRTEPDPAYAGKAAEVLEQLCMALEAQGSGTGYKNVRALSAKKEGDRWYAPEGGRAEAESAFCARLANLADGSGSEACVLEDGAFRYVISRDGWSLSIYADNAFESGSVTVERAIMSAIVILFLMSAGGQYVLSRNLRRISWYIEQISNSVVDRKAGQPLAVSGRLEINTGDELESMASAVNSLADFQSTQGLRQEAMERSYRRFVPERVLSLLGKNSIEEVDKESFAVRRMAVMAVSFHFPESFYANMNNSRLLFDSFNSVIEHTASIASKKGGTVFNFSYDGYDVVMECDTDKVVSTAVAIQQAVLSLNEKRAAQQLPEVRFAIALDIGEVMLGIVGDDTQMQPATISSGFSVVRELLKLCRKLEAGILCTEDILYNTKESGSRYIGKCNVGNMQVRVYEIFEGDSYQLRRAKAGSGNAFTRAVLELYSGNVATAKRQFLQLAHANPGDGGARWYLYLADQMEQNPDMQCVLNQGGDGQLITG